MSPIDRLLRCLVFSSFLFLPACRPSPENEEQDDPSSQPVPITVARVAVTTLRPSIDLIGTMTAIPEQLSIIATQVSGLIEQVLVVEGQSVHTGEVLVVLDSRRAQSRLAGARAVAEKARAVLTRLEHGPRPEEIEAALARAEQLSAVARSLSSKFEALGELHDKKDVSDVEYGQAKARLEAAQAESRAARARLRMLQAGTRQEEIAEARAELARAEADAASAALAVEFCTIVSPIAGVVTSLTARQGTYVSPVDILATVLDNSTLFVQVRLPSAYLP
ncbi:MAG: efflux RND transporter periplasmic adaptor subunit, partial [Planctomycetes bacterium]|nr:efflux RND transporter periplasmic adaptor subunit [Planctomycetota bacterium]